MSTPKPGDRVLYRDGDAYLPATAFDIEQSVAHAGLIHARPPLDGCLNLEVELPDGRIAGRLNVPCGDMDGGYIAPPTETAALPAPKGKATKTTEENEV